MDSVTMNDVSCSLTPTRYSHNSTQSSSCQESCPKHTRLCFEPDADIVFKLFYTDYVIGEWQTLTTDDRVATLYHAKSVLLEATEQFGNHELQSTQARAIGALQTKLSNIAKDTHFIRSVHERLLGLQDESQTATDPRSLEEWHMNALAFVHHAAALTDFGIDLDPQVAHETIDRIHNQLGTSRMRYPSVDSTMFTDDDDISNDEQILTLRRYLPLMGQDGAYTEKTILKRFRGIFKVYEALNIIMQDQESLRFKTFVPAEFAETLNTIQEELVHLLSHFDLEASLKDQFLRSESVEVLCQGSCHALVAKSKPFVQALLVSHLQNAQHMVNSGIHHSLEDDFTQLSSLLSAFELPIPAGVPELEWNSLAPRMLTPAEARNFSNKLQVLYTTFQNKVYKIEELSRLWLAVWRGLKATYLIVRHNNFQLPVNDFPVEQTFFSRVTVRNQFELVLSSPEPLNHIVIDNIVGEYCILIAECLRLEDTEYGMLQQLKPTTIQETILDTINKYTSSRHWSDLAIRGIQKCAIRLNHLTNGPAFIRRSQPGSTIVSLRPLAQWKIEPVSLTYNEPSPLSSPLMKAAVVLSDTRMGKSSAIQRGPFSTTTRMARSVTDIRSSENPFDRQANDRRILATAESDEEPGADGAIKAADTELYSVNAVSAFDYVIYPFPETRAIEVAQSRQIARDLSQPGIFSRGALEHDVINRPPRHTWPPGTVSIWAKPLPIDPLNVLKEVWSVLRDRRTPAKRLRQAKPRPAITPRTPRKEWVEEHPRLRPLRDRRRRVKKPSVDHKSKKNSGTNVEDSPTIAVPKLRGGGPKTGRAAGEGNSAPGALGLPPTPKVTLTSDTKGRNTQQLMDRMRGLFRGGVLPPVNLVQQHFLEPNDYNVDAAYDAARRFVNYGLLDGMANTNVQGTDSNQTQPNSNPFVRSGVTIGVGLNPIQYGLPVIRASTVQPGQTVLNSTPVTPTPVPRVLTRVSRNLQPVLPAHMVPAQAQVVDTPAATSGQNAFSTTGLPAPFRIFEDSPAPQTPVATPRTPPPQVFAPNQQHQAQIDRANAGLPPHRASDNSSNQENTTPLTPFPSSQQGPLPTSPLAGRTGRAQCRSGVCHPCPQYQGQYHHVCSGRVTRPSADLSGLFNTQQPSSSLRSIQGSQGVNPVGGAIVQTPNDSTPATSAGNGGLSAPPSQTVGTQTGGLFGSLRNTPYVSRGSFLPSSGDASQSVTRTQFGTQFLSALARNATQITTTTSIQNNNDNTQAILQPSGTQQTPQQTTTTHPTPGTQRSIPDSQNGSVLLSSQPQIPTPHPSSAQTLIPTTPAQPSTTTTNPPAAPQNNNNQSSGRNSPGGAPLISNPVTPTPRRGRGRPRGSGRGRGAAVAHASGSVQSGGTGSGTGRGRGRPRGRPRRAGRGGRGDTPQSQMNVNVNASADGNASGNSPATDRAGTPLRRSSRVDRGERSTSP